MGYKSSINSHEFHKKLMFCFLNPKSRLDLLLLSLNALGCRTMMNFHHHLKKPLVLAQLSLMFLLLAMIISGCGRNEPTPTPTPNETVNPVVEEPPPEPTVEEEEESVEEEPPILSTPKQGPYQGVTQQGGLAPGKGWSDNPGQSPSQGGIAPGNGEWNGGVGQQQCIATDYEYNTCYSSCMNSRQSAIICAVQCPVCEGFQPAGQITDSVTPTTTTPSDPSTDNSADVVSERNGDPEPFRVGRYNTPEETVNRQPPAGSQWTFLSKAWDHEPCAQKARSSGFKGTLCVAQRILLYGRHTRLFYPERKGLSASLGHKTDTMRLGTHPIKSYKLRKVSLNSRRLSLFFQRSDGTYIFNERSDERTNHPLHKHGINFYGPIGNYLQGTPNNAVISHVSSGQRYDLYLSIEEKSNRRGGTRCLISFALVRGDNQKFVAYYYGDSYCKI